MTDPDYTAVKIDLEQPMNQDPRSDGQRLVNRVTALSDSLEDSARALARTLKSLTGEEVTQPTKLTPHPMDKPTGGFFPATQEALTRAEQFAEVIKAATAKLRHRF